MMLSHRQSRMASLMEAIANTAVGYGLAVLLQHLVFAALGMDVAVGESMLIAAVFTVTSLLRTFVLRRIFERLADKQRADRWERDGRLAQRMLEGRA